jgi:hypothetical protein
MPYYDLQGGGSPVNNTSTIILTKENNPLKFKAGYYTAFDLTTNVGDAKAKKIVYRHHQCSTSQSNLTYDDGTFNTNGAKAVSNLTVQNGQTVSTVKGGCYQTPYYKYTTTTTTNHPAVYGPHNFVTITNDSGGVVDRCTQCGMVIGHGTGGSWGGNTCKVRDAYTTTSSQTHYSTTRPSNPSATYYLKSCPYSNGQTLSAEITY